MKYQARFSIAITIMLALALSACHKNEGDHGHSHDGAAPAAAAVVATAPTAEPGANVAPSSDAGIRSDEVRVTLKPNQGTGVKMVMKKGQKVDYSWQADGGPVNHDTHGEAAGKGAHRYSKGVQVAQDSGALVAAFDGDHGWFWRNRNDRDVTITLKVNGEYQSIAQKK